MDNIQNEQTMQQTQNQEDVLDARQNTKESNQEQEQVSLGKFKDVNALIRAYNSLQSEFTKRCQRIKELEGEEKGVDKVNTPTPISLVEEDVKSQGITEEDKKAILKDYLKSIVSSKQKAILMDDNGIGLKTPISKPKTIAEAGALAREIF